LDGVATEKDIPGDKLERDYMYVIQYMSYN